MVIPRLGNIRMTIKNMHGMTKSNSDQSAIVVFILIY